MSKPLTKEQFCDLSVKLVKELAPLSTSERSGILYQLRLAYCYFCGRELDGEACECNYDTLMDTEAL